MDKLTLTPRATMQRINQYLAEGKRFDGRAPGKYRDLIIEKDVSIKAEGSVRVKLGDTEVIVGVKVAAGEPYADSPNKGNLMVTAELSPISSARIESGPPKFPAIELGRVVDRGIRESGVIDVEQLVIKAGEKVWTVFVDIYSINDGGNLLDAAGIGALAALKIAKLPKYDEETGKVLYGQSDKALPLTGVDLLPITVFKIGNNLLVDPTREEEDAAGTRLTIGVSKGIISSMQKGHAQTMTADEVVKAIEMANDSWKDLYKTIEALE